MQLKDFIQNFADQFERVDAAQLTADTVYKDLEEWSSLMSLSVLAMVDEEYDVALTGNDIRATRTLGELFDTVKAKQD